jgi:urate oxidase
MLGVPGRISIAYGSNMSTSAARSQSRASQLSHNAYGKSGVRLTKVIRHPDRQELQELTVNVELEGAFESSYIDGDNKSIIATDSMKNAVYVLAASHPLDSIESFAIVLAKHFLDKYEQVKQSVVNIVEDLWVRIPIDGKPHPHAFISGGQQKRATTVMCDGETFTVQSSITSLQVAKTTNSQFWGFVRDEYTTLPETKDRIMGTSIDANWVYGSASADADSDFYNSAHKKVYDILLDVFATHESMAVQQTLYQMGDRVISQIPEIDEITILMPNQHRIMFNLEPFGQKNKNEIFYPIDEPFGLISGTVSRGE